MPSSKLNKEQIDKLFDGTKVYLVDGEHIRNTMGVEGTAFVYGGHGYIYDFIPKDEIWIERTLKPEEQKYWGVHELFEWVLMKYLKYPYEKAHPKANSMEHTVRLLEATNKLRSIVAQTATQAPPKPHMRKMPDTVGWHLKTYSGPEADEYLHLLKGGSPQVARRILYIMVTRYGMDERFLWSHGKQYPLIENLKVSPKNAIRKSNYILSWDFEKRTIDLYQVANDSLTIRLPGIAKLAMVLMKRHAEKPEKVTEIADAIQRDNPDISEAVAHKMAWETYCSYVNPSYDGCTSKGKSHRKSPKSDYED